MAVNGSYSQKSGYVKIPIDMGADTAGVSAWYDALKARFDIKGIKVSIEKNGNGTAILKSEVPYRADVITQIRKTIMKAISEDLNPEKTEESLLRPALETSMYLNQKNA